MHSYGDQRTGCQMGPGSLLNMSSSSARISYEARSSLEVRLGSVELSELPSRIIENDSAVLYTARESKSSGPTAVTVSYMISNIK